MINNYDNLDFCLKILFDYQYNKNDECYEILGIDKNKVDIKDIKKQSSFNYGDIMSGNFKFMHAMENKIYFKRHNEDTYPCNVAISIYNDENTNNMNSGELINMGISYLLGAYALNNNFKHILLPIFNFDMIYGEIKNINPEITKYIDKDTTDDTIICVNVTEHYFKMMTLKEFIKHNIKTINIKFWKVMIFQVLYTLYFISKELLQFRHNKLDLDSIMLYKTKTSSMDKSLRGIYKVGDTIFEIPDIGYIIKLCNFENSTTISYYKNKDSDKNADNPFYDVHYFIHELIFYIKEIYNLDTTLYNFYEEIIPKEFRYNKDNFNGLDENTFEEYVTNIITPSIIMRKNNFFTEFIQTKKMYGEVEGNPLKGSGKHINIKTETESEFSYKMLGKKINYKEKKNSSNNNMNYNSRKLYYPSENDIKKKSSKGKKESSLKSKDSNIFNKAEESYNRMFNKKSNDKHNTKHKDSKKNNKVSDSSISPINSEKSLSEKILSNKDDDIYNFVEDSISSLHFDHIEDTQREKSVSAKSSKFNNDKKKEMSISSLHLNFDENDNTVTERIIKTQENSESSLGKANDNKSKEADISSLNFDNDDNTDTRSQKFKESMTHKSNKYKKTKESDISSLNLDNIEDTEASVKFKKKEDSISSLDFDDIKDTEKSVKSIKTKKNEVSISSLNFDNDSRYDTATERINKEASIKKGKKRNEKSESTTEEELSANIEKEIESFLKIRDEMTQKKPEKQNESGLINQNSLQNVPQNIQKVLDKLPNDFKGEVPEEVLLKGNDIRNQLPNLGSFNNHQMNQQMNQQMNLQMDQQMNQQMSQQTGNQMMNPMWAQQMDNPMNQQIDQMNSQMNQQMNPQIGYPKMNNSPFQYPSMTKLPQNKFSGISQFNPNLQGGKKEETENDFFFEKRR